MLQRGAGSRKDCIQQCRGNRRFPRFSFPPAITNLLKQKASAPSSKQDALIEAGQKDAYSTGDDVPPDDYVAVVDEVSIDLDDGLFEELDAMLLEEELALIDDDVLDEIEEMHDEVADDVVSDLQWMMEEAEDLLDEADVIEVLEGMEDDIIDEELDGFIGVMETMVREERQQPDFDEASSSADEDVEDLLDMMDAMFHDDPSLVVGIIDAMS